MQEDDPEVPPDFSSSAKQAADSSQAETALQQSQAHLEAIFQGAEVGISEISTDGYFLRVNEKLCWILARTREDILTRSVAEVTFSDDVANSQKAFAELLTTGRPVSLDNRYWRPDGSVVWASSTLSLLVNQYSGARTVLAVMTDMTQRRKAEEALRQSEERLRIVMESVTDHAIITTDTESRITGWNTGAQNLFGYTEAEALGQPGAIIFTPEDKVINEPQKEIETAHREGRAMDERYHIRKDGSRLYVSGVTSPLYDVSGELLGYVKVARDLTERRDMEEALREADRRKDEFLALLAHELRNPMATLSNTLLILDMTGGKNESLPLKKALAMMSREVKQLVRLVDDLLDVSRISRGKTELRQQRLELIGLVRQAVESSRPLVEAGRRQFTAQLPEEPLFIRGDSVRLTQVVRNLLGNAAKFTHEGGHIWLSLEQEGQVAVLRVRDNGIGIPAEQQGRIFDMFAQVDASRTRSQSGLGLGLTLVREFVELHGGQVNVYSDGPGTGSSFEVRLPLSSEPKNKEIDEQS